jgi:hypothetical protein
VPDRRSRAFWAAGETETPAFTDSRADRTGLPADGASAWWPSRYGAEDQIGTLNEITPEVSEARRQRW